MSKLTRRQTFNSLVFPIMTLLWAGYCYVVDGLLAGFAFNIFQIPYFLAAGIGCVLCIVLTVAVGIETGQYFLPRLLILISTVFVNAMVSEFIGYELMLNFIVLLTSLVISAVYFKTRAKFSEWIIVFLSNPVLYAFILQVIYTIGSVNMVETSGIF